MSGPMYKKAKEQAGMAFETPILRARDWTSVPCQKRLQMVKRFIERTADKRDHIKWDVDRLDRKIRTVTTMQNPGWEDVFRDADKAQNTLRSAVNHMNEVIRSARHVLGWARRDCRR